ncbi:putative alpha helix protein [Escherichia coli]|uniref:Putative alpha helix protein n=1 Tax=Escherichia coli TaxID=562 RepID=A0A2X1NEB9_ECOLX|nr:putative alpha helix protein [Escherichia coli]
MQEFNRESNTLASKSINAEVTNSAIELKVLIEQMPRADSEHRITRNANSYFSAFTNAATQTERHFLPRNIQFCFCVPAPDFAMFFAPAH